MPTVQEALDRIWSDEGLKSRLLSNPKPVLREFGLQIPDGVSVQVHENTPTLINAVLPVKPSKPVVLDAADPISRIVEQAWQDAAFKAKLLSDPKEAAAQSGLRLPDSVSLKVWENSATVEHMVLPLNPAESELSDTDLEAVAGGGMSKSAQTGLGCGIGSAIAGIIPDVGSIASAGVKAASQGGQAIASSSGKC